MEEPAIQQCSYIVSNGAYRAYDYLPTGSRQLVAVVDHPVVAGGVPHAGYSRRMHVYRPKQHNKFTPILKLRYIFKFYKENNLGVLFNNYNEGFDFTPNYHQESTNVSPM